MVGGCFAARIRVIDGTKEEAGWFVGVFLLILLAAGADFFCKLEG